MRPTAGVAAVLLACAAAAGVPGLAGAAAGQEPDTIPAADTIPPPEGLAAPADTPGPPPRPPAPSYFPPRFALSVMVGTAGLGDLQAQAVAAERLDAGGVVTATDTLDRVLSATGGVRAGVSALVGLTRAWAVRAGASWAAATLAAGYDGDEPFEEAVSGLAPSASTDVTILSAEGALRFRMASSRRVQPYAELGAGVLRVEAENAAFPGAGDLTGETSVMGLAALGAIVPIRGPLVGRFQASGQFFRTPAGPAPAGTLVGAVDTLRVTFAAPREAPFADPVRELVRSLRLELGFSIELGRMARPRGARVARPSGARP